MTSSTNSSLISDETFQERMRYYKKQKKDEIIQQMNSSFQIFTPEEIEFVKRSDDAENAFDEIKKRRFEEYCSNPNHPDRIAHKKKVRRKRIIRLKSFQEKKERNKVRTHITSKIITSIVENSPFTDKKKILFLNFLNELLQRTCYFRNFSKRDQNKWNRAYRGSRNWIKMGMIPLPSNMLAAWASANKYPKIISADKFEKEILSQVRYDDIFDSDDDNTIINFL